MLFTNKATKSVILIIIIITISKVFGFIRETVIAAFFGAARETDAYFLALSITSFIFASIGTSLASSFIPIYSDYLVLEGEDEANDFSSNLINIILIVSILLSLVGYVFAPQIVRLFAPGFQYDALNLTIFIFRVIFPIIIFLGVSNIVSGILQTKESFIVPVLTGFPINIAVIFGTILFSQKFGIYALAWATVIASALELIIQLPALRKHFKYKPIINFKDSGIQKVLILVLPILLGTFIVQIDGLIGKIIASNLKPGSISAIAYANKLIDFVKGVFIYAIMVIIYPLLSKLVAKTDFISLKIIIAKVINIIMMIVLPITIGTIIFQKEIIKVIFERGAFNAQATKLTCYALVFYIIGLSAYGVRELISRVFYSLKDTKTPVVNGIIIVLINITLSLLLIKDYGIGGLGLAASLSNIIGTLLLLFNLRSKIGNLRLKESLRESIKIFISSLIMGMLLLYFKHNVEIDNFYLKFVLSILVGIIAYFLSLLIFKVKELKWVLKTIKREIITQRLKTTV